EPSRAIRLPARGSASTGTVSGVQPASPKMTARSVEWPLPVADKEPRNSVCTVAGMWGNDSTKVLAARMGPTVCEDDGPTPMEKMSMTLIVISRLPCAIEDEAGK